MKKNVITSIIILTCSILVILIALKIYPEKHKDISFSYPFSGTLFPPEFQQPVFRWNDSDPNTKQWQIEIGAKHGNFSICDTILSTTSYQPSSADWEELKRVSRFKKITVQVTRISDGRKKWRHAARLFFQFSEDSVGAPILYREIPLPFAFAEANPDSMSYRLVNVGSENPPHTVMKKFMVCGNCHSFSDDGRVVGLDFDAAHRDKGGYFITEIADTMVFDTSNYLS